MKMVKKDDKTGNLKLLHNEWKSKKKT
jgi:hypothetical protein